MANEDVIITYTVRELLAKIESQQTAAFARLEVSLASKADKADVTHLTTRLDQHDDKIKKLETRWNNARIAEDVHAEHDDRTWNWKRRVWAIGAAIGMMLVTFWGPYAAVHLHL